MIKASSSIKIKLRRLESGYLFQYPVSSVPLVSPGLPV